MNTLVSFNTKKLSNNSYQAVVTICLSSNELQENGTYCTDPQVIVTAIRATRAQAKSAVKDHILYYRRNKEAALRLYYAKEDINVLKQEGVLIVTGTKEGNISFEYANGVITCSNCETELNEKQAVYMLAKLYIIE